MNDPERLIEEYCRRTNLHRFEELTPLIDDRALYWFSDGSVHEGIGAIRAAFEHNWNAIRNETYRLENVRWVVRNETVAVCVYHFRWEGDTSEGPRSGAGRGTSVLHNVQGSWRVVHEHLSRPAL